MSDSAEEQFKRDFITKALVQQIQFEQWLKILFHLNQKINEEYNAIYQDAFYTKLNEMITIGIEYTKKVLFYIDNKLEKKKNWHKILISGFEDIISLLTDPELDYIEYRRHNFCHLFQNGYEYIQDNLKIKKERNGRPLQLIIKNIEALIKNHGNDQNIDKHINRKLQPALSRLYNKLTV